MKELEKNRTQDFKFYKNKVLSILLLNIKYEGNAS